MAKGKSSQAVREVGSLGQLEELFGKDAQKRVDGKQLTMQSCIVKGCDSKFWVPYGRHYTEGGDVNRGTCDAKCERAYQADRQIQASIAEAAFFDRQQRQPELQSA